MKLTENLKNQIDSMSYETLLYKWRFATLGDPIFQDESGEYFSKRMKELKELPGGKEEHVQVSKSIGWEK